MSPPDSTSAPKPYFPDPIEDVQMDYAYFGLSMQQNRYALPAISILLEYGKPSQIMEFGTRFGGLSVFLGMYAKTEHIDVSYF
jgi:cephalosporin hydroxylase